MLRLGNFHLSPHCHVNIFYQISHLNQTWPRQRLTHYIQGVFFTGPPENKQSPRPFIKCTLNFLGGVQLKKHPVDILVVINYQYNEQFQHWSYLRPKVVITGSLVRLYSLNLRNNVKFLSNSIVLYKSSLSFQQSTSLSGQVSVQSGLGRVEDTSPACKPPLRFVGQKGPVIS